MSTTFRDALEEEMLEWGDGFACIEASTVAEEILDLDYVPGYFTIWTLSRVYFPVVYDNSMWVGSVARHPDGKDTPPQGGC